MVVGGTRVIFNGEKEASISVDNPDNEPYLIQSSLDNQQSGVDKIAFIITPPLFRLDGHQRICCVSSASAMTCRRIKRACIDEYKVHSLDGTHG